MKKTFLSIIFLSYFGLTSFAQAELYSTAQIGDNQDLPLPPPNCNCSTDYLPVCGDNGIIYLNACEAECYGVFNYSEGVCEVNCASPNLNTFGKVLDISSEIEAVRFMESPNCGYFIVGEVEGKGVLVRLDNEGETVWEQPLAGDLAMDVYGFLATPNQDGFLIYGKMNGANPGAFLIKIDNDGNPIWNQTYPNTSKFDYNPVFLPFDELLIRTDYERLSKIDLNNNGELLWTKDLDFTGGPAASNRYNYSMHLLPNEEVMIICEELDFFLINWNNKIRFLKIDYEGNSLTMNTATACCSTSPGAYRSLNGAAVDLDGNFHLLIYERTGNSTTSNTLIKRYVYDSDGNEIDLAPTGHVTTTQLGLSGNDLKVTSSGDFLIAGKICAESSSTSTPSGVLWLCDDSHVFSKVNADSVIFNNDYLNAPIDLKTGVQVEEAIDGGIILLAKTSSVYYLAKTDENGEMDFSDDNNSTSFFYENSGIENNRNSKITIDKVFPNPASSKIEIQLNVENELLTDIQIFDTRGMLLKSKKIKLTKGQQVISLLIADLPNGIYSIKIPSIELENTTQRFVKM